MTTRREFLKRTASTGIAVAFSTSVDGASEAARLHAPSSGVGTAQTVLGDLDVSELGFTLTHEHIANAPDVLKRWPKAWGGRAGLIAKAVDQLKAIKAAGINTVVDLTTYDGGRDIRFLEEVSRKSGMNVIACTGQRFFPPQSRHDSQDCIRRHMLNSSLLGATICLATRISFEQPSCLLVRLPRRSGHTVHSSW